MDRRHSYTYAFLKQKNLLGEELYLVRVGLLINLTLVVGLNPENRKEENKVEKQW